MSNALTVTGILLDLLDAGARITAILQNAQVEGREISDEELASIQQDRKDAWQRFEQDSPGDVGHTP